MTTPDRELRLMETFVGLLSNYQKGFEGFARDAKDVRYCHIPIDGQQISHHEYALRSMGIRLLAICNRIQAGRFGAETLDTLVQTEHTWASMKSRMGSYLDEIHQIISRTFTVLRSVRESLVT